MLDDRRDAAGHWAKRRDYRLLRQLLMTHQVSSMGLLMLGESPESLSDRLSGGRYSDPAQPIPDRYHDAPRAYTQHA